MSKKPKVSQEKKRQLKKLREKGLYNPKDARKAPTKYALSLTHKYKDVLDGNATVITVPKSKRSKGFADARKNADASLGVYAHRNKLVVPKNKGENVFWSKKDKTYKVSRWSPDRSTRYVREPLPGIPKNLEELKAMLKPGQRVTIPFNRPGRGIEWMNLSNNPNDPHSLDGFWKDYVTGEKATYKTAGEHAHVFYVQQGKRRVELEDEDGEDE